MKKKISFLIDGYGFVYRAYYVHRDLCNEQGIPTGAVFGFINMLLRTIDLFNPQAIAVIFDHSDKNFRHTLYPHYKANRQELPEALKMQFPLVRKATELLNFKIFEISGYEADDVIASLANTLESQSDEVVILSSDKDLMQLINDKVCLYDPIKANYIRSGEVQAKFGVSPKNITDFLALVGDASDNVPGVKGIGPKAATELLSQFNNLEDIIYNLDQIKNLRKRQLVSEGIEDALLSKRLVSLRNDLCLDIKFEDLIFQPPKLLPLYEFLQNYQLKTIMPKVERLFNFGIIEKKKPQIEEIWINDIDTIDALLDNSHTTGFLALLIKDQKLFLYNTKIFIIDLKNTSQLEPIKRYLEDDSILKITYDLKQLFTIFDVSILQNIEDLMIMHYAAYTGLSEITLDKLQEILPLAPSQNIITSFYEIFYKLKFRLAFELNSFHLYKKMDLKLVYLLYNLEKNGVLLDTNLLKKLSLQLQQDLLILEQQIWQIAGREFNIGSPKQLGEILFDKLQYRASKTSIKSKNYVTDSKVLEALRNSGAPIAQYVLEWRHISKLKNTYIDALINQQAADERIYTTYLQTSTNTTRLSSVNPNLQNIPIRTEIGNKIREAFIAPKGYKLLSADYSQIELRILSVIADVSGLQTAFLNNSDIHTDTACKIFRIDYDKITSEQRRYAKAINFGIIYGMSPFGLSQHLGITMNAAKEYIDQYFLKYPEIIKYTQDTKNFAHKYGYIINYFSRKCFIKEINNSNYTVRSFAERAAVNAPIQSSSADIMKLAMLNIQKVCQNAKMLLQIHDELLFEIKETEIEKTAQLIKATMENIIPFKVPLLVEISIGDSWGRLTHYA